MSPAIRAYQGKSAVRGRRGPAVLLARVFQLDALACPRCGARMKLVAALTDADSIRDYLTGVGRPADPPAIAPARPPPQQGIEFVT